MCNIVKSLVFLVQLGIRDGGGKNGTRDLDPGGAWLASRVREALGVG